jgi:peptidyl-prolyl cis-trans isomerase A (cyclophilin A)
MPRNQPGINAEISRSELDTPRTGNKSVPMNVLRGLVQILGIFCVTAGCATVDRASASRSSLLDPNAPEMNYRAPEMFKVRLETSKGNIVIEVHREWAPHGTDRFYNLVCGGYYDEARFFRVIEGRWAQFGINGNPHIANLWRTNFIPDDPAGQSNIRGTVAFAFAVPNGRTTQVFINLKNNSATHDREPFVPFGKIIAGMDVADALNAEYGESIGGIRAGKQDAVFQGGNSYLEEHFPHLDFIKRAVVIE